MGFIEEKQAALATMSNDASPKGSVDEAIKPLLDAINAKEQYYTLSSCSGRISLATDYKGEKGITWLFVSHNVVQTTMVLEKLQTLPDGLVWLRQEDIILHVGARTLEDAVAFLELAQQNGYKHAGILNANKRFVVEIRGERRMDVPVANDGKLLVSKNYIDLLCNRANDHLEKAHAGIRRLHDAFITLKT